MSKQTFDEFVKKQVDQAKANQATNEIDWNKTREDWLRELCDLYSRMEKYLKKYTDKDQIRIRRDQVHLSEDHLGTYEAETLTFLIGHEKVVAKPIGTLLIGAWGRVDLVGARGSLRIVLLEKGGPTIRTRIEIGRKTGRRRWSINVAGQCCRQERVVYRDLATQRYDNRAERGRI